MEKSDSYSHIVKYTGLFGGVQGLNILIGVIRNKFIAMILGPSGMGLMSLFNSTVKLISDSTNLGLSMSAVREISDAYEHGDEPRVLHIVKLIRMWSLLVGLLGVFICIALSPFLNQWTFTWGNHILHFILLSPVVGLTAITGGELAILKGTRQLKHLAVISVYNVVSITLLTIPLLYYWRQAAIVPSLVIGALVQMLLTIGYSYRLFALKWSVDKNVLGEGMGMVKLGIAFVLAGILGSGAEFLIRTFLNTAGELADVGLYNAGYMMTMTYAGMVFSAMETDYFPRLSAIKGIGEELNRTVNRQIEVSLLLISPLLVTFMIGMPVFLPLLYSGKFMSILGMTQVAILAMFLRAVNLPISYISLSKGDSLTYLLLEAVYDVLIVLLVIVGYRGWGIWGTGVAITISAVADTTMIICYTHYKYGYSVSTEVRQYLLLQFSVGIAAYLVTYVQQAWLYWSLGVLLSILSFAISIHILRGKSHLWAALVARVKGRRNHD